jgi:hypothetical protein
VRVPQLARDLAASAVLCRAQHCQQQLVRPLAGPTRRLRCRPHCEKAACPPPRPRAERLIATAVLGFAASEAAGRFRHHDQSVIDEDFAELLRWLRRALPVPGDVP